MKESLKPLRWTMVNGAVMVLACMATFEDVEWAGNLVKFILWVSTISYLLSVLAIDKIMDDEFAEKATRSVPEWVDKCFDITLCLVFAFHGWFFYAALNMVQFALHEYLMTKGAEYRRAQAA